MGLGAAEIFLLLVAIAYWGLLIFCLIDVVRANFKDSTTKLLWVVIILFAPFIGSVLYLAIGRKNKLVKY